MLLTYPKSWMQKWSRFTLGSALNRKVKKPFLGKAKDESIFAFHLSEVPDAKVVKTQRLDLSWRLYLGQRRHTLNEKVMRPFQRKLHFLQRRGTFEAILRKLL